MTLRVLAASLLFIGALAQAQPAQNYDPRIFDSAKEAPLIIDPALLTRPASGSSPAVAPNAVSEARLRAIEDRLLTLEERSNGERRTLYVIAGCAALCALVAFTRR